MLKKIKSKKVNKSVTTPVQEQIVTNPVIASVNNDNLSQSINNVDLICDNLRTSINHSNISKEDINRVTLINPLSYFDEMTNDLSGATYHTLKRIPMMYDIKFDDNGIKATQGFGESLYSYISSDSNTATNKVYMMQIFEVMDNIINQIKSNNYKEIIHSMEYKSLANTLHNNERIFDYRVELLYHKWLTSLIHSIITELIQLDLSKDEVMNAKAITYYVENFKEKIFDSINFKYKNFGGLHSLVRTLRDVDSKNPSHVANILFNEVTDIDESSLKYNSFKAALEMDKTSSVNEEIAYLYNKVFDTIFVVYCTALEKDEINSLISRIESIFVKYHDYLYDLYHLVVAEYALYFDTIDKNIMNVLTNHIISHAYDNKYSWNDGEF